VETTKTISTNAEKTVSRILAISISHYWIIEKLGASDMGEVYRAEGSRVDRQVAMKVLSEMFSSDPERLDAIECEALGITQSSQHSRYALQPSAFSGS
jgi:serine/threonine protein kinase